MSKAQRNKGARFERDIVNRHRDIGIWAERYPASGATHFRGAGHDVDVYLFGTDAAPLVYECKTRKEGKGSALIRRWLGDADGLLLHEDREETLVTLPWRVYERMATELQKAGGFRQDFRSVRLVETSAKRAEDGAANDKETGHGTTTTPNGAGPRLATR